MAPTSSLNCFLREIPYQSLHSLNTLPSFNDKTLFFTDFSFIASPSPNSISIQRRHLNEIRGFSVRCGCPWTPQHTPHVDPHDIRLHTSTEGDQMPNCRWMLAPIFLTSTKKPGEAHFLARGAALELAHLECQLNRASQAHIAKRNNGCQRCKLPRSLANCLRQVTSCSYASIVAVLLTVLLLHGLFSTVFCWVSSLIKEYAVFGYLMSHTPIDEFSGVIAGITIVVATLAIDTTRAWGRREAARRRDKITLDFLRVSREVDQRGKSDL